MSRYDRDRPVSSEDDEEARAYRAIARMLDGYPGIPDRGTSVAVARLLYASANELGNGRAIPLEMRRIGAGSGPGAAPGHAGARRGGSGPW